VPDREKNNLLRPENAFIKQNIIPVGIFSIQSDFDAEYVITSLSFVREILNREGLSSALEILCSEPELQSIQQDLEQLAGDRYLVSNRYQQHAFLYQILSSEKLAVFLILSFILIIATFNILGSLTMLMIDKKKDIKLLFNLGASALVVKAIFFFEGVLTTILGTAIGVFLGLFVAWLQIKFDLVKMGNGSFVIDSYPVVIEGLDVAIVVLTVLVIGSLASIIPSYRLSKRFF